MKLRFTSLIILAVVTGFIISDSYFNVGYTNPTGAPAARCGSIAHPLTCTDCHTGGSNAIQPGWITSNIPAYGYTPGTVYTITASATSSGRTTYGFEITCENPSGTKKGAFIITSTQTKLVSVNTYVTHTSTGISWPSGTSSWSFNWTAPAAGTGTVTFYGAFLCANGDTHETGDLTFKANLPVAENVTTGITENTSEASVISIYPNPAVDHIEVSYDIIKKSKVEINLHDLSGKLVAPLYSDYNATGNYHSSFQLPFSLDNGIYFLEISTETGNIVKKILVQR